VRACGKTFDAQIDGPDGPANRHVREGRTNLSPGHNPLEQNPLYRCGMTELFYCRLRYNFIRHNFAVTDRLYKLQGLFYVETML